MIALQCIDITKSFGADTILHNIKMDVKAKERVALVGRNGAGKSTLLKIITGELASDSGQIVIPKDVAIGYLDQHSGLDTDRSIWEEMLTVFTELRKMEKDLRGLEEKMSDPALLEQPAAYEKVLSEYDSMQHTFKERGGYQFEADIRGILSGLRFGAFDYDTSVNVLSGGQKTRLALAKLLLSKPELLILDEPTNHLDIDTLRWLEQYLSGYDGAVLIVSHDRYFLDKIVQKVYEIAWNRASLYQGNYSYYIEEKAFRYEQELKTFEKQQKEIAELEDFVQRNIARASTTKRAQSRRKKLEKMDRAGKPDGDRKSASFSFSIDKESGNDVLMIENVTIGYPGAEPIINNLSLNVKKGESVALIGQNGVGKSTLLKALKGDLPLQGGTIRLGSKVKIGYYDQEQADLNTNKDVLHELWDDYPQTMEKDIRTVLGNFLFTQEDVLKKVYDLSGGEKARLALAKLMMQKPNVLLFDEPTNHLDLDSKEVLESALIDYPGTLVFVSHDRYFLNRMATRIVELSPGGLRDYIGDYDYFIARVEDEKEREAIRREEAAETAPASAGAPAVKTSFQQDKDAKKNERRRQRQIETIEASIEELESRIEEHEQQLLDPDVYSDHEKAASIQASSQELKTALDQQMEEWEMLQEEE